MFLSKTARVSFADGNRTLEYTMGVMHRLKTEYPEDVLIYSPDYGTYDIGCGSYEVNTEKAAEGVCYLMDFTLSRGEKEFKVIME